MQAKPAAMARSWTISTRWTCPEFSIFSGRTKPLKPRLQRNGAEPEMGYRRHLLCLDTRGLLHLAVVIDLFARGRVVGWAADRLLKELVLLALRRAVAVRCPSAGLIHHADRDSQYCSVEYQAELRKNGISISMSGKGNCFDNAMVETFFKPSRPNSSGAPSSRAGSKPRAQSAVTSTASTIPSAAIRR